MNSTDAPGRSRDWRSVLKPYEGGDARRSLLQFSSTLVLYLAGLAAAFVMVLGSWPYWAVLLLSLPIAGLHVRLFIIMHDCGHNAYFRNPRLSAFVGRTCALIAFTPYYDWVRTHAVHHATVGDLDRRGVGDVWTMTLEEYRAAPWWRRGAYRVYRNPIFLLGFGPLLLFLVVFRFPRDSVSRRSLRSVLATDLALAAIVAVFALTIGILPYLMVMLPVLILAGTAGVWLFFVQHQYRDVYWSRGESWDMERAALDGSSFYDLPGILRWFSGNIGYHHIHHLNPRIPNYSLRRCWREVAPLRRVQPITLWSGFRSMFLQLWDEESQTLVHWRALRALRDSGSPGMA